RRSGEVERGEHRVGPDVGGEPGGGGVGAAAGGHAHAVALGDPVAQGGVRVDLEELLAAERVDAAGLGSGLVLGEDPAGRQVQGGAVVAAFGGVPVVDGDEARPAVWSGELEVGEHARGALVVR